MNNSNYKSGFDMHYNATEAIQEKARILRKQMTKAEKLLWKELNNKNVLGYKFRRQHPIDIFIADFYCHKAKLVIEVDGEIHCKKENKEYDYNRIAELKGYGIKVIRFTNCEIENNIDKVIKEIERTLIKI